MIRFYLGKIVAGVYLLCVGVAVFLIHAFPPPGDIAYLSVDGILAAWLLTLPWSIVLVPLMWSLFHDGQNMIFSVVFVAAAGVNGYLINRLVNGLFRRQLRRWASKRKTQE